jgi:hypothetical protein
MKDKRKLKLADALEQEKNTLPEYSILGTKNDVSGYDDAIKYLRTDRLPEHYEENEILIFCIEDIDTLYRDYDID